MKGLGTIVNTLAVIAGSGIGMLIKGGIKEQVKDGLTKACGIATMFIGVSGTLVRMISVNEDGSLSANGTLLLILSLVIGGIIGELINIEKHMDALGGRIQTAVKRKNDSTFVEGFVSASLVICIGAMAIVGSLQDGLTGDHSMLFTKALLDFIIVMVMASAMGLGVMFSALPILVYQGLITLLAVVIAPFISETIIAELCLVGNVLIFCVGINLTFGKKIRVGNFLPALLVPIIWEVLHTYVPFLQNIHLG